MYAHIQESAREERQKETGKRKARPVQPSLSVQAREVLNSAPSLPAWEWAFSPPASSFQVQVSQLRMSSGPLFPLRMGPASNCLPSLASRLPGIIIRGAMQCSSMLDWIFQATRRHATGSRYHCLSLFIGIGLENYPSSHQQHVTTRPTSPAWHVTPCPFYPGRQGR